MISQNMFDSSEQSTGHGRATYLIHNIDIKFYFITV